MKKIIFLLCLFFVLSFLVFSLDFNEALNIAFKNNPDLESVKETLKQAKLSIKQSNASFLPDLKFIGNYTRTGVIPEFEIPGMGRYKFGTADNFFFELSTNYLLYDWNRRSNLKNISQKAKEITENNLDFMKKTLALSIANHFIMNDILLESEKVFLDNIKALKKHLKVVKKRYEIGYTSSYDLLSTKVQISGLEDQLIQIRKSKSQLKISLKNILNIDKIINIEDSPGFEIPSMSVDELVNIAFENREDLKNLNLQKLILSNQKKVTRTSTLPILAFQANYQLRTGMMPDVEELRSNWNLNLSIQYKIFDGFKTKYEKQILDKKINSNSLKFESKTNEITTEIETCILNIKSLQKSLEKEQEKLELARKAYEIISKAYKEGNASNIDVLEASSSKNLSELSVLKKKNSILQEKLNLFNKIGLKFWGLK